MAASLHKTKRRIASVNSTKKITNAMELVATVKLKRFKNIMMKNNLYQQEMVNIIHHLFEHVSSEDENPYLSESKGTKSLYIVINSNLGLCASFNNDIYNFVNKNVPTLGSELLIVGAKGDSYFKKSDYSLNEEYVSLNEKVVYEDVIKLGNFIHREFIKGTYKAVYLVYTKYVNSIKFVPDQIKLFPLKESNSKADLGYEPIYDPSIKTLIEELVPIYVTSTLYQKIIESQVSEQASRRTAMENATDNADEIINKLTLEYNKARQSAITQEIAEIVSGQQK